MSESDNINLTDQNYIEARYVSNLPDDDRAVDACIIEEYRSDVLQAILRGPNGNYARALRRDDCSVKRDDGRITAPDWKIMAMGDLTITGIEADDETEVWAKMFPNKLRDVVEEGLFSHDGWVVEDIGSESIDFYDEWESAHFAVHYLLERGEDA